MLLVYSDPAQEQINGTDRTPTCRYEVLRGAVDGESVKYANLGDILIHKWTCDTSSVFGKRYVFQMILEFLSTLVSFETQLETNSTCLMIEGRCRSDDCCQLLGA